MRFSRFASDVAQGAGSAWVFFLAAAGTLAWLITGPAFHFSDTWQLVMNTITSIITFLMVFLIQNTQNRDTRAINLKLDEIIRAIGRARNEMIDIEHLSDEELEEIEARYQTLRAEHEARAERRRSGESGGMQKPAA